jgi:hypothetical protein
VSEQREAYRLARLQEAASSQIPFPLAFQIRFQGVSELKGNAFTGMRLKKRKIPVAVVLIVQDREPFSLWMACEPSSDLVGSGSGAQIRQHVVEWDLEPARVLEPFRVVPPSRGKYDPSMGLLDYALKEGQQIAIDATFSVLAHALQHAVDVEENDRLRLS